MNEAKDMLTESQISTQLVQRIIEGDKMAENEMVERYGRGLVAMLNNRSNDNSVSGEVANETWLVVLNKIRNNELRNSTKLAAFIVQTGKNQLLMFYRKNKKHKGDDVFLEVVASNELSPEQQLANKQLGLAMGKVLGDLKKVRDRELITKFYVEGLAKKDLCSLYGLTEAHFDRVLFRARQRFKEIWNKQQLGDSL